MAFEMQDGEDVTVSAFIDGNKIRAAEKGVGLVEAKEINPTKGLVINTK